MATDQKLISQIMDLSRNVEKLSGEMKKNTSVTSELTAKNESENKEGAKDQAKILDSLKGLDFKGLKDELSSVAKGFTGFDIKGLTDGIKGLDFKGLSKDLKGLDFDGLSKNLKGLDFKGLGDGLKNLDIKGLSTDLKKLDFKDLTQSIKGIDLKGLADMKGGLGDIKNLDVSSLAKGDGVKDLISGSIGKMGKGLLGAFESGGVVKNSGAYLVGEKGPEIANLPKDTTVIPNDKTEAMLSGNPASIKSKLKTKKGAQYPSKEEIDAKRNELLKEDPDFYSDPVELNAELEYYIDNYKGPEKNDTFTIEDVQKLGKPSVKNDVASAVVSPPPVAAAKLSEDKAATKLSESAKPEAVKNKNGLFSKIFGKKESSPEETKKDSGIDVGNMVSKGAQLLSSAPPQLMGKFGDDAGVASGVLDAVGKTEMPKLIGPVNAPEIKNSIPSLSKKMSQPKAAEQNNSNASDSNIMEGISDITSKSGIGNAISGIGDSAKSIIGDVAKGTDGIGGASESSGAAPVNMDEVVDVLTKILNVMKGPLKVSPMDSPFRPNSKRI
jgi:hypothetical protein